jgi:hypothetical protein
VDVAAAVTVLRTAHMPVLEIDRVRARPSFDSRSLSLIPSVLFLFRA